LLRDQQVRFLSGADLVEELPDQTERIYLIVVLTGRDHSLPIEVFVNDSERP
jgi:hypothetical protein